MNGGVADDEVAIGSAVTGAGAWALGYYEFTLNPGKYIVCEDTMSSAWRQSKPANTKCDAGSGLEPGGHAFTITSGSVHPNNDFGNYQPVKVRVNKTVSGGVPPAGVVFDFQIREGASTVGQGTLVAHATTDANGVIGGDSWTVDAGPYPLDPGTYQLCELIVNGYTPSFVQGTYGVDWFSPGIAAGPGEDQLENLWACFSFTVSSGDGGEDHTVEFGIDNSAPGMARTIGYWKNWTSCDGRGNQAPVLDTLLHPVADDDWTPNAGGEPINAPNGLRDVRIGDLVISGPNACALAVDILDKRKTANPSLVGDGAKVASNAAWNMAAQLMAYEMNLLNGADGCAKATSAATYARRYLNFLHFTGNAVGMIPARSTRRT